MCSIYRYTAIFILLISLLLSQKSYASVEAYKDFTSGNWTGFAYRYKDNKEFSHCSILGKYKSGNILGFGVDRKYNFRIMIGNDKWEIPLGSTYNLSFTVDKKYYGPFESNSIVKDSLTMEIGDRVDIFKHIKKGRVLTINAAKDKFYFRLTGTNTALDRLLKCAHLEILKTEKSLNPFNGEGTTQSSSPNPFGSSATKEEDDEKEFFKNIIRKSLGVVGFENIKFVPGSAVGVKNAYIAWKNNEINGWMHSVDNPEKSADEMIREVVSLHAKNCKGNFASQKPYENSGKVRLVSNLSSCSGGTEEWHLSILSFEMFGTDSFLTFMNMGHNLESVKNTGLGLFYSLDTILNQDDKQDIDKGSKF